MISTQRCIQYPIRQLLINYMDQLHIKYITTLPLKKSNILLTISFLICHNLK
ncbi:hypothetical protein MOSE0_H00144 [Monosporozyma servazzii]